jgi:cobalt-zinc-cadmium resistance protein CzcA
LRREQETKQVIRAIIDWALRNRLLVLLLTVLGSVLGVIVYERMPKDIYPDLNAPLVNIITSYPGMPDERHAAGDQGAVGIDDR